MLNDLTGFAAVPGAEQERFHQLFEAASYKFRQRFAAPTRARPSAAPGGSAPAAVAHGLPMDPPRGRLRPARFRRACCESDSGLSCPDQFPFIFD